MAKREYVQVIHGFGSCGLEPSELIWIDERQFPIERILHTCTCIDEGSAVTRYTALIQGQQKYLYRDQENRWYVKVGIP